MSRINGDKARGALQRRKRIVMREKARAIRAAKTTAAKPAESKTASR